MIRKLIVASLVCAAVLSIASTASALTRWTNGENVTSTDGSIDCGWHGNQGDGSALIDCVEGKQAAMYYEFRLPRRSRVRGALIETSCPSLTLDAYKLAPRDGWVEIAFVGPPILPRLLGGNPIPPGEPLSPRRTFVAS